MQVLELPAVFEIITGLQLDILFQRVLYLRNDLLYIGIAHIHSNHDTAFGRISVYLQRTVHQLDTRHLADGYLDTLRRADKQLVEVKVRHFIVIQPQHKVEAPFVLKNHASRLPGIGRADNRIQFLYIHTVTGNLAAVVPDHQLRKSHRLLHNHVGGTGHLLHIGRRLFRPGVEFLHVFAIQLDGDVRLGTRHQLVEPELYRLAEIELRPLDRLQRLLHLLHHLGTAGSRRPFLERLHDYHHIGILHRHRVGRHLRRPYLGNDMFDFGELLHQRLLRPAGKFDTLRQRTSGGKRHLHRKVTFIERRDKLRAQPGKQQQRSRQQRKSGTDRRPGMMQAETQAAFIKHIQLIEETVGKGRLCRDGPFQEERSHHRHIGKRENQRTDNTEDQRLCHRRKIFAFNPRQRQDGKEHNQDNQDGKGRTAHHAARPGFHFPVQFSLRERPPGKPFRIDMRQYPFKDNNRAVHHDTEVDRPQAHQVGRHAEDAHQNETEEHRQRNNRSDNQPGTYIPQKDDQHQEDYQCPFNQVAHHGRDIPVHQL